MARTARAPDGRLWVVRRLWLPRLRRRDRDRGDGSGNGSGDGNGADGDGSGFDLGGIDDLGALVLVVLAVAALALFVVALLPFVFFLLELLVLPLVLAYRIVFGKPFTVEARSVAPHEVLRWQVVGWRRSGEAVRQIAGALERGEERPHVSLAAPR